MAPVTYAAAREARNSASVRGKILRSNLGSKVSANQKHSEALTDVENATEANLRGVSR
jgi:hypothetical protein